MQTPDRDDTWNVYGSDANGIRELIRTQPALGEKLHPKLPYVKAEVIWAVRQEMARTVEDVLARRTRSLLLDAQASIEAARVTAEFMASELRQTEQWQQAQVAEYISLARGYLLN
jgi:glycerol-3-phosphate dehydrogenase